MMPRAVFAFSVAVLGRAFGAACAPADDSVVRITASGSTTWPTEAALRVNLVTQQEDELALPAPRLRIVGKTSRQAVEEKQERRLWKNITASSNRRFPLPTFRADGLELVRGLDPAQLDPRAEAATAYWQSVVLKTIAPSSRERYGIEPENVGVVELRQGVGLKPNASAKEVMGGQDEFRPRTNFGTLRAYLPHTEIFAATTFERSSQQRANIDPPAGMLHTDDMGPSPRHAFLVENKVSKPTPTDPAATSAASPARQVLEVVDSVQGSWLDYCRQPDSEIKAACLELGLQAPRHFADFVNLWFPIGSGNATASPLGFAAVREEVGDPSFLPRRPSTRTHSRRLSYDARRVNEAVRRLGELQAARPGFRGGEEVFATFVKDQGADEAWVFASNHVLHGAMPVGREDGRRLTHESRWAVYDKSKWEYDVVEVKGAQGGALTMNWRKKESQTMN